MTTTKKEVVKDEFYNFIEYLKNSDIKVTISEPDESEIDAFATNCMYNSCNDYYAYDNYAEFHPAYH